MAGRSWYRFFENDKFRDVSNIESERKYTYLNLRPEISKKRKKILQKMEEMCCAGKIELTTEEIKIARLNPCSLYYVDDELSEEQEKYYEEPKK